MASVQETAQKQVQDRANLITRAITTLVLGPVVLYVTYLGGAPFLIAGLLWAGLGLLEFYALGAARHLQGMVILGLPIVLGMVLAFAGGQYLLVVALFGLAAVSALGLEIIRHTGDGRSWQRILMTLAGLLYTGLPPALMVEVRGLPGGLAWIVLIFAITWGTDTFAYLGGRLWGKRLLAPRISPKKTVEGAVIGILGGCVSGWLVLNLTGKLIPALLGLLIIGPPLAVIGDLFESYLKRFFQVGDSHLVGLNLLPGHGGILDRTDALVWVTTLCYVAFKLIDVG
jgi:phosphatidate cytidylyltransferase